MHNLHVLTSWAALVAPSGSTQPNAEAWQPVRTVLFGRRVCAKPYKSVYTSLEPSISDMRAKTLKPKHESTDAKPRLSQVRRRTIT